MATYTGFEPVVSCVTGRRLNRSTNRPVLLAEIGEHDSHSISATICLAGSPSNLTGSYLLYKIFWQRAGVLETQTYPYAHIAFKASPARLSGSLSIIRLEVLLLYLITTCYAGLTQSFLFEA